MLKGIYISRKDAIHNAYNENARKCIQENVSITLPTMTSAQVAANPSVLNDIDFIFSTWGMIRLDENILSYAPKLKVVYYAAGSIKGFVTDAMYDRGIIVLSAYSANAIPVAEYTFAQIILSTKRFWANTNSYINADTHKRVPLVGCYNITIGIVSLGMIGSIVCEMLKQLDVKVIAYDPFATKEKAESLGIELCSLEEVFTDSNVVSLHTPWLKETENMIDKKVLTLMKENATLINTARGAVINEDDLIDVFKKREDLYALLDVTYPEPPVKDSPFYEMENIVLTPHIAGSQGNEISRMGQYMVDELLRYVDDKEFKLSIPREMVKNMA